MAIQIVAFSMRAKATIFVKIASTILKEPIVIDAKLGSTDHMDSIGIVPALANVSQLAFQTKS